jgi:hypothetical protein
MPSSVSARKRWRLSPSTRDCRTHPRATSERTIRDTTGAETPSCFRTALCVTAMPNALNMLRLVGSRAMTYIMS